VVPSAVLNSVEACAAYARRLACSWVEALNLCRAVLASGAAQTARSTARGSGGVGNARVFDVAEVNNNCHAGAPAAKRALSPRSRYAVAAAGTFAAFAEDAAAAIRSSRTGPRGRLRVESQPADAYLENSRDRSIDSNRSALASSVAAARGSRIAARPELSRRSSSAAAAVLHDEIAAWTPPHDSFELGDSHHRDALAIFRQLVAALSAQSSTATIAAASVPARGTGAAIAAAIDAVRSIAASSQLPADTVVDTVRSVAALLAAAEGTREHPNGVRLILAHALDAAQPAADESLGATSLAAALEALCSEFDAPDLIDTHARLIARPDRRLQQQVPAGDKDERSRHLEALQAAAVAGHWESAMGLWLSPPLQQPISTATEEEEVEVRRLLDGIELGYVMAAFAQAGRIIPPQQQDDDAASSHRNPPDGDGTPKSTLSAPQPVVSPETQLLVYCRHAIIHGIPVRSLPLTTWAALVGFCRSVVPSITASSPSGVLAYCALEAQRCVALVRAGAFDGDRGHREVAVSIALSVSVLRWCASMRLQQQQQRQRQRGGIGAAEGQNVDGKYLSIEALDCLAQVVLALPDLLVATEPCDHPVAATWRSQLRSSCAELRTEVADAVRSVMRAALPEVPTEDSSERLNTVIAKHVGLVEVAVLAYTSPAPRGDDDGAACPDVDWILQLLNALGRAVDLPGDGHNGRDSVMAAVTRSRDRMRTLPGPSRRGSGGSVARVSAAAALSRLVMPPRQREHGIGKTSRPGGRPLDWATTGGGLRSAPLAHFLSRVPASSTDGSSGAWRRTLELLTAPFIWQQVTTTWTTRDTAAAFDRHVLRMAVEVAREGTVGDVLPPMHRDATLESRSKAVLDGVAALLGRHPNWLALQTLVTAVTPPPILPRVAERLHLMGVAVPVSGVLASAVKLLQVALVSQRSWWLGLKFLLKEREAANHRSTPLLPAASTGEASVPTTRATQAAAVVVSAHASSLALALLYRTGTLFARETRALQLLESIPPYVLGSPADGVLRPSPAATTASRRGQPSKQTSDTDAQQILGEHITRAALQRGAWRVGLMSHSVLTKIGVSENHDGMATPSSSPRHAGKRNLHTSMPLTDVRSILLARAATPAAAAQLVGTVSLAIAAGRWADALKAATSAEAVPDIRASLPPRTLQALAATAAFARTALALSTTTAGVSSSARRDSDAIPTSADQSTPEFLEDDAAWPSSRAVASGSGRGGHLDFTRTPMQASRTSTSALLAAAQYDADRKTIRKHLRSLDWAAALRLLITRRGEQPSSSPTSSAAATSSETALVPRLQEVPLDAHITHQVVSLLEHAGRWREAAEVVLSRSAVQRPLLLSYAAVVRSCHFAGHWQLGLQVASEALLSQPWPLPQPFVLACLRLTITANRARESLQLATMAWALLDRGVTEPQLALCIIAAFNRAEEYEEAIRFFLAQLPHGAALDRRLVKHALRAAEEVRRELSHLASYARALSSVHEDTFQVEGETLAHTRELRRLIPASLLRRVSGDSAV
jgi:hypothetical protein